MGWLLIDEEFFIICAFLGFLALAHKSVALGIGEGLDLKIASIYSSLLQSRDAALQSLAQIYDFYQIKGQLAPLEKQLRVNTVLSLTPLVASRYVDHESLIMQREMQLANFEFNNLQDIARIGSLDSFYDVYGTIRKQKLLNPFVANLGLDNLAHIFDRRAQHDKRAQLAVEQAVATVAFLAIDGDCVDLI